MLHKLPQSHCQQSVVSMQTNGKLSGRKTYKVESTKHSHELEDKSNSTAWNPPDRWCLAAAMQKFIQK